MATDWERNENFAGTEWSSAGIGGDGRETERRRVGIKMKSVVTDGMGVISVLVLVSTLDAGR